VWLVFLLLAAGMSAAESPSAVRPEIVLKAWGVPDGSGYGPMEEALLRTMVAFRERFPWVKPVPATGISIPDRGIAPLMQIAGDVSPDVIYVNFRLSDTYVQNKFLYPLDRFIEKTAGVSIPDGHLLDIDAYIARLKQGPDYVRHFEERIPRQCWEVMRRRCPYGLDCPYLKEWGVSPVAAHTHTWSLPQGPLVMALFYRRDLFAEAGLPDRPPATMEEFMQWARRLTNPKDNVYGLSLTLSETGWETLSFLYSLGGRAVELDDQGNWHCVFDSDAAVEAYTFTARLFLEPFTNDYGRFTSVVDISGRQDASTRYAMRFWYLDEKFFSQEDPNITGFGPVPQGPTGLRGSEFNSRMSGIYAGIAPGKLDAAWEYMLFYSGREARRIQADVFVEKGMGRFLRPRLLREAGYPEYIDKIPPGWDEAIQQAMQSGVPEPYGRNCQQVYRYMSMAIDQIRNDAAVRSALEGGRVQDARKRVREILKARVALADEKMLNIVPPGVRRLRTCVAAVAAAGMVILFVFVFRKVFRTFSQAMLRSEADRQRGDWQFGRYKLAYLLLLPALLSIAVWVYYPLFRGTLMAFQDYNVRGFSRWTGFDNFAIVLFNPEFWFSMGVSLEYTVLYMVFGFAAPLLLALLLAEVPRGKMLFRTLFYLPAVLSGVVVIFLWKGFYGQYGMINQLLNFVVHGINAATGGAIPDFTREWLASPQFALFFCLLPTIWAGMGPGCLIYLAALKTIPDDLYEAADIDGAGILRKVSHVTFPSMRALIVINFVGAVIGAMKSGSQFILAMTGGGPYTPFGQTEVIGLHIFWEAFGFLRFGVATAMAWVLGSILIGFTVLQLQRLSRMEFKAAGGMESTQER
jgi:multiple sugar transport system permease protein